MTSSASPTLQALLAPWNGPYGGLPPFDTATPASIEQAVHIGLDMKRAEVAAIAANPAPPTFENTIIALEDCGRALQRALVLYQTFSATRAVGEMPEVSRRLASLIPALEDEIAHDDRLHARVVAVHADADGLGSEQRRLTEVVLNRRVRRGAGLDAATRTRLADIHQQIAALQARFNENLIAEQDEQFVFIDDPAALVGLSAAMITAAAEAAHSRGYENGWAVVNTRPSVWPVLTSAHDRELRRRVREMWMTRGEHEGVRDNRPVVSQILKLRGQKAGLLGFASYAHLANADRMSGTPDRAMGMLMRTWLPVLRATQTQLADLQSLAHADGLAGPMEPWDRLYYAERMRQSRFNLDADAVRPYLELEAVLAAAFDALGRLHGWSFKHLPDAPVVHPDIRVMEVIHNGLSQGVIWLDLIHREGKMRGSWQAEYRPAETFQGRTVSLVSVNSNLERTEPGGPVLLTWEYANVLFHEFGHAVHMLSSRATYPTLGSMGVAWDMIELPALLNERWLQDRDLLTRFACHHETGEPMPATTIDGIERAAAFDRVFSVQLDFLAAAIIDMRLHLLADGRDVDPMAVERETLADLGLPQCIDMVMRVPHFHHAMTDEYAAGVYSYLWADVMAADVTEAFLEAEGELYDSEVANRWRETVLTVGNTVDALSAFRAFRGRDPDPDALLRRFGLLGGGKAEPMTLARDGETSR